MSPTRAGDWFRSLWWSIRWGGWPLPRTLLLWAFCLIGGLAAGDLFLSGPGPVVTDPGPASTTSTTEPGPASTTTLGPDAIADGGRDVQSMDPPPSTSPAPPDEPESLPSTTTVPVGPATTVEPSTTISTATTVPVTTTAPVEEYPQPERDVEEERGLPRARGPPAGPASDAPDGAPVPAPYPISKSLSGRHAHLRADTRRAPTKIGARDTS